MQDMQEGSGVGVPHIRNQWHCKMQATACIAQVLMACDVDLLAQAVWRRLSLLQETSLLDAAGAKGAECTVGF